MTVTRSRRFRAAGWALFGVLALSWTVLLLTDLPAVIDNLIGTSLVYLLPMALALTGSCALALDTRGAERHFWGLVATATAFLVSAECYWTWYTTAVDPRGPRLPAPFEIPQAASAVLFLFLVTSLTTFSRSARVTRARFYLDVVGAMVASVATVYWFWTLALFADLTRGGWLVSLIAATYFVVGGTFLIVAGVAVTSGKGSRWRSWERLIVASLTLYGVGLVGFPVWYRTLLTTPTPLALDWFSVFLGFGFYLLFMAILYRATVVSQPERLEVWHIPRLRRRWVPVLYPVGLSLALPVLGWLALRVGGHPYGVPIVGAAFVLAGILILRSWLTAVERAHHRELAITDPVSGAYNHRYLHERLSDDVLRASTARQSLAIVVVDIDDFKGINNVHGHLVGDEVLRRIAEILQAAFGLNARVFRFGSDEFVAVVTGATAQQATEYVHLAHKRVSREITLTGTPVNLSAGIAIFPLHGTDEEQLLSRALAAQQLAKVAGAQDVIVYDECKVGAIDPFERLERARRRSHRTTVATLAAAVDARDSDTRHHSENVAELAAALAQVLGMSEQQSRVVALAARLHDIGKIGVRDDVLMRTEPLNDEERAHIEEHPVLGERILAPAHLDEILPAVRHHHERWDGTGYPDGLRGPQIPLEARVLCVCDAFEAMTSVRTYRPALTVGAALIEIEKASGTQFDPEVASAFARMVTHLHGYAGRGSATRHVVAGDAAHGLEA